MAVVHALAIDAWFLVLEPHFYGELRAPDHKFDEVAWQKVMNENPSGSLDWEDPEVQKLANLREGERLPYLGLFTSAKPLSSESRRYGIGKTSPH